MYNYQIRTATAGITTTEAFTTAVQSMDDLRAAILWIKLMVKTGLKASWNRKTLAWEGAPTLADTCYYANDTAFGKRMLAWLACGKSCGGRRENWRHLCLWSNLQLYVKGDRTSFYKVVYKLVLSRYAPHLGQNGTADFPLAILNPPSVFGEDQELLGWLEGLCAQSPNSSEGKDLRYLIEMLEVLFVECTVE